MSKTLFIEIKQNVFNLIKRTENMFSVIFQGCEHLIRKWRHVSVPAVISNQLNHMQTQADTGCMLKPGDAC